ncbi:histidine kinase [Azospirillum sp. TSH100]|uniref:sensor histidine kinase n=1 Tax=Azospirillum sp. TSH100 TaxID=652764 RepID=UPI000D6096E9|nr:extracellular solute-binding protein [Azospirillum sp. TSH100]PWC90750.1 histidine kinase [Azospirillum sp. TSH100]QCG90908.1 extracellular solute-binding protein [Azospirillum sp. TSH100]
MPTEGRAAAGGSLRRRLLSRMFVVLGVVTLILFLFVRSYAQEAADSAYDQLLSASALSIADAVRVENGAITVDLPYSSLSVLGTARHDRVFYKVMAPGGLLVTGYEDLPGVTVHDDTPVFQNAIYSDAPVRIAVTGRFISGVPRSGWVTVVVAQTREARDLLASKLVANSFAPIAFAVVVGGVLLWFGVRQALAPLAFLEALIRARQPQDFTPIDAPVPTEVGQLLAAINQLVVRFKASLDSTQSFLADAAHQIRTPLAALRSQAELARREADVERLRNRVERIHRNAVEASELTTQLLNHATVVHRAESVQPQVVDLDALLRQIVQQMTGRPDAPPITLTREPAEGDALLHGDPVTLREALSNLLDNAVKYGGAGSIDVQVRPGTADYGPLVEIADRGPGIPDGEKSKVFERFSRGRLSKGIAGSGLGLSIAAAVAEAHHAALSLLDRPGGGLIVRLEFPTPDRPAETSAGTGPAGKRMFGLILLLMLPALPLTLPRPALALEPVLYPASAGGVERLRIDAATDRPAIEPLIRDFQQANPTVTVEYREMNTGELYESVVKRATGDVPDLVISSASGLQVKLVNDGHARRYSSPATEALPDWAIWRSAAFGFTQEPAAIVFNRDLVPAGEVPRSREDLIHLLRDRRERYRGRVVTYDIEESGIGYLFATQDSVLTSQFWQLADALGENQARQMCCTSDMVASIERGESLIGYNLLGSYARERQLHGAHIGIVLPSDYTLVMTRVALIPQRASAPDLAGRFIDYLLSERGQAVVAANTAFYSIQPTVGGPMSATHLQEEMRGPTQRIALGPALLVFMDHLKRARFLQQWKAFLHQP